MTGLIPRPFIEELLNRTDIVELIDGYVSLKKRGNSHIACCPFHHEKTPSFNVISKKQFYHCFGCGASGNAISFVMNYLQLGFVEAVETLATRLGMQVPREGHSEPRKQSPNLYQLLQEVAKFYQQTLKTAGHIAIEYLKQRKVSGETARLYQLGYAPSGWHTLEKQFKFNTKDLITTGMLIVKEDGSTYDRYRHRITFPIHDRHGRIIGFGGRAIEADQKPKYLNSPETILFQKNRELYGLHQVIRQQSTLDSILIVEGYMDVIALAQHGISNAVATLGTATSLHHIQLLSKHTKHIIFCFDGDEAGRQAAWRALESSLPYLNTGLEASFIFLPEKHDPDSLVREEGKESFLQRIQQATPLNQFFIATITKTLDTTTLAGKSQLVHAAKPYLLKMGEGPYWQLMIDELARLTRIEPHRIQQLIEIKNNDIPTTSVNIARSPIRIAIALLVQHPEIYSSCAEQLCSITLDGPKQTMLQSMIEQVAHHPGISTAALVELWRESPMFDAINKLAAWDHQVPEEARTKEFMDIVLFLAKQNQEKKIQKLLEKARNQSLTETDRLQLQEMLKQRHKEGP
ncbi:DNA primase [Legionella oakridgensis]|uniref:DNA primase n=1 Tax=Legionella oakridgensis TaxID=29423 RepID=A0A0W0XHC9_9GAMM|nr:DNA primase [Legionella oakridgensis]ETO93841.1 DNA primase [Legionella oakridgensis RV-2-2007]KTD43978.1 DNA primase DnaG [Legionella oakridgensis]STY16219.1 DNA primase DnaG [Legionella longbeachae]